jgi:hypothetical protein
VRVRMQVLAAMMEDDVTAVCGPKGRHDPAAQRDPARARRRVGRRPGRVWSSAADEPTAHGGNVLDFGAFQQVTRPGPFAAGLARACVGVAICGRVPPGCRGSCAPAQRWTGQLARADKQAVFHADAQVAAEHRRLGGEGHLVATGGEDRSFVAVAEQSGRRSTPSPVASPAAISPPGNNDALSDRQLIFSNTFSGRWGRQPRVPR